MHVWDVRLHAGARVELPAASGWNTAAAVLQGNAHVKGSAARDANLILLDQDGDALLLLLSGKPLHEPIVGRGRFVMNTQAQIVEAIADLNSGKFGKITH